jgi:hypothetical protein
MARSKILLPQRAQKIESSGSFAPHFQQYIQVSFAATLQAAYGLYKNV